MKRAFLQKGFYWLCLAILLLLAAFLLFTRLGDYYICECDEARHGINAYEMLQNGDYVVNTYNGEPDYWNLKPPLSYYCIMLGYRLFGFGTFGLRFYSAASMLLCMSLLALWMKKQHGSIASLGSVLFFLGCHTVYGLHFARFGDADAQMVLLYMLAMLCMLESQRNIRFLYGTALFFGLSFLSKSWHAALIPVTCLLFLCVSGQLHKLRPRHYAGLVLCGLAPILPWALARYSRDGLRFFEGMLSTDVYTRATTVLEGHEGDWAYYIRALGSMPAVVLSCIAGLAALLCRGLNRRSLRPTTEQCGVALWILTPLVLYSLCVSKLEWYVYVCLPAFALLFGKSLQALLRCPTRRSRLRWPGFVCALALTLPLCLWTWQNWLKVSAPAVVTRYQSIVQEYFDREINSGDHLYVEHTSIERDYFPEGADPASAWFQGDQLNAMFCGDLVCLPGGGEAFREDEDHAYLLCNRNDMDESLLEEYPIIYEDGPLVLLEN